MDEPSKPLDEPTLEKSAAQAAHHITNEAQDIADRAKVARNRSPSIQSAVSLVEDVTRAAPLVALGAAFIVGAMFASRRRRR